MMNIFFNDQYQCHSYYFWCKAHKSRSLSWFHNGLFQVLFLNGHAQNAPWPSIPYHEYAFLHSGLFAFSQLLTKIICLTIKSLFIWWSFPLFSWPWCLIKGWYCEEKLELLGVKEDNLIETQPRGRLTVILFPFTCHVLHGFLCTVCMT